MIVKQKLQSITTAKNPLFTLWMMGQLISRNSMT